MADVAKAHQKRLRVATKSVRVPALLKRIFQLRPDVYKGLMCFSTLEAEYLATVSPTALIFFCS